MMNLKLLLKVSLSIRSCLSHSTAARLLLAHGLTPQGFVKLLFKIMITQISFSSWQRSFRLHSLYALMSRV